MALIVKNSKVPKMARKVQVTVGKFKIIEHKVQVGKLIEPPEFTSNT